MIALKAFSLMELMFTLALLSVLTLMAIPKYQHYWMKVRFYEIVQASYPLKLAVELCFQAHQDLSLCDGGYDGIPKNQMNLSSVIERADVSAGVIRMIPHEVYGLSHDDDYLLVPSVGLLGQLVWHVEGGAVQKGLVTFQ